MSKHTQATTHPISPAATPTGADVLHKMLLAVLTAILAARPFVRAEDPGMISDFSDPGGMVLTTLTFCLAVAWAGWRLWSHEGGVQLGPVEIALAALAGVVFLSAYIAPYQRAGFYTAAEWVGLAVLLFLVRQLAARPQDQHGLMTALLATAVTLAAHGVFQAAFELPRLTKEGAEIGANEFVRDRLLVATDHESQQLLEQFRLRLVSGPFLHPASMAAAMVLLLPLLGGALVACVRGGAARWRATVVLFCLLLGATVLGLTRDATAIAALALVALPWAGAYWPARRGGVWAGATMGLIAAAGVVVVMSATGLFRTDLARWREVWPAAWRMSGDHFWRGVGPAQFRYFYPRYMAVSAGDHVTQPSSSLLEMLCESGVPALVLLLVTFGLFLRTAARWGRGQLLAPAPADKPPPAGTAPEARWEYYLGGMLGALLAFTLRANSHTTPDPFAELYVGAVRVGVWFFAFALFDGIAWSPGEFVAALVAGVAGLALTLLVGPGVAAPSLMALLWACAGLALAVIQPAPARWVATRYFAGLSIPAMVIAAFVYFAMVMFPASNTASKSYEAKLAARFIYADAHPRGEHTIRDPQRFIEEKVITPLLDARREDPGCVRTYVLLGKAHFNRWLLDPVSPEAAPDWARAVQWMQRARAPDINPEGPEGYLGEFHVREDGCQTLLAWADGFKKAIKEDEKKPAKKRQLNPEQKRHRRAVIADMRAKIPSERGHAAAALEPYLPKDPTNAHLLYRFAKACFDSGTHLKEGEAAAREALELNEALRRPYRFTDQERRTLEGWLSGKSVR